MIPVFRRQNGSSAPPSSTAAPTTPQTSATPAPTTSTPPPETTTPATTSSRSSSTTSTTSETSTSSTTSSTSTTSSSSTTSTMMEATTIVTSVITPVTTVTVGSSTFVSSLRPSTIVSSATTSPTAASNTGGSSELSSGAMAGIIAGSVVGGVAVIALLLTLCICSSKRRKAQRVQQDNIIWPEIAASADDRAALYPEATHATGRSGVGDMDEVDGPSRSDTISGVGGLSSRNYSQTSSARQPQLPSVPASVYDDDYPSASMSSNPMYNNSSYASHQPLARGVASIDYLPSPATPSPPRFGSTSSQGGHNGSGENEYGSRAGVISEEAEPHEEHQEIDRPVSPEDGAYGFGGGYRERTKLGVVNH